MKRPKRNKIQSSSSSSSSSSAAAIDVDDTHMMENEEEEEANNNDVPVARPNKIQKIEDNQLVKEARESRLNAEIKKEAQEKVVNDLRQKLSEANTDDLRKQLEKEEKELARLEQAFDKRVAELIDLIGILQKSSSSSSAVPKIIIPTTDEERLDFLFGLAKKYQEFFVNHSSEFNPEKQAKLLGPLNNINVQLPIIQNRVDMRVFDSSGKNNEISRSAALRLKNEIIELVDSYFLIAVPGSGKTSTIFDLAREFIVIYMQCTPSSSGNAYDTRQLSYSDNSYILMYKTYLRKISGRIVHDDFENWKIGKKLVICQLIARMLVLIQMNDGRKDLVSSWQFLIQQINTTPGVSKSGGFVDQIFYELSDISLVDSEKLFHTLLNYILKLHKVKQVILAVDEILVGGPFGNPIHFANVKDAQVESKNKGFVNIIENAWSELVEGDARISIVFAGTGTGYSAEKSLITDIGKEEQSPLIMLRQSDFPMASAGKCKELLSIFASCSDDIKKEIEKINEIKSPLINLLDPEAKKKEDLSISEVINLYMVNSRFRLIAGGIEKISNVIKDGGVDPYEILRLALIKSLVDHQIDLSKYLLDRVDSKKHPFFVGKKMQNQYLLYLGKIYDEAVSESVETTFTHEDNDNEAYTDLVQLGIATSAMQVEGRNAFGGLLSVKWVFTVTERFVLEAINFVFANPVIAQKFKEAGLQFLVSQLHHTLAQFSNTIAFKGNIGERIMEFSLASNFFDKKTIDELDFMEARYKGASSTSSSSSGFAAINSNEDSIWNEWKKVAFKTNGAVKLMNGSTSAINELAKSEDGTVYLPDKDCRSDAILMLPNRRALVMAVAIYSTEVPKEKVLSQLDSTDMSRAYCTVKEDKVNKPRQRDDWESKGLHLVSSIRVQINLPKPHASDPKFSTKAKFCVPKDTVINDIFVNLDKDNIHLLLGKAKEKYDLLDRLYKELANATKTDPKTWPGTYNPSSSSSTSQKRQ